MRENTPLVKKFYSVYNLQDEKIHDINKRVITEIIWRFNPKSVFEFGCNNGKNLSLLPKSVTHLGIDVNWLVIEKHKKTGLDLLHGDESFLRNMGDDSFDVSFTCSVLNHIEYIDDIVRDLKRISRKGVVCMESDSTRNWRWFPHDYKKLGFTHMGTQTTPHLVYDVWIMI